MGKAMNLNRISASEAARLLNRRDLTAEQLARACLARIEQREPEVQAWTALRPDAVLAAARELDRGPIRGVLHGLPLGVKDMFDTADLPTAYGSGIYQSHQPRADAAAVALCRDAGALVLGKTATTEFATYHPGPTRNPRNTAYTPGGSSSGSAAAVAGDMVPLALGTQTAGSVIRPAAYCGVVGYKPSFGRISRAGLKSLAETLDTVGMFARSVDDVALLASVLMRDARLRELRYDGTPRVAMFRSPQWRHTLPETRAAFERAARALSQAGAVVEELAPLHSDVMAYEAAQALAFERIHYPSQLSTKLAAMLEAGAALTAEQYLAHLAQAGQARAKVAEWLQRYDVLLAPSATGEAPFYDQGTGDPLFCRAWTLFGVPCVHLPFAQGPQGLPVGLQVVGGFRDDQRLLAIARWMNGVLAAD
ncbi:amidase [Bordetella parapertussis]|uniref:Amidase n=2 Tax=Bordetella parapertussis TaxID=519 RepID=Q7W2R4_BORPA|nr:amidase [Bordetella parapertussis]QJP61179.1 amidase [Bordetella parapertussis]QJP68593.1 amidase [Bordetella parapertussis]CAE39618.1 amidase [Bordetella parapertussis]